VEQIRSALDDGRFPLIVTEGRTEEKAAKILHNAYLTHGIRSFASIQHTLFVFGHSLALNDDHILNRIAEGKITDLYVSLFGDTKRAINRSIIARARGLASMRPSDRPLRVTFYDAESAEVWGKR
jgi:hypothetical protein